MSESPVPPADDPPPVPEAMSLDDARALLVREHAVAVPPDDPLLMLVSLHRGFLADYERLLARHDRTIGGLLGATGTACAEAVEHVLDSLKDKTVKASLDQAFALVERQALAVEQMRRTMRRHALFHLLLTLLSITACLLALVIARSLTR
jgi:hypothetical protein